MFQALRRIVLANPMGVFIWSILAKWYVLVLVATLVITFWVFKSLDQIGFITYVNTSMTSILDQTKSVARYCIPKLGGEGDKIMNFWNCLGNPPKYEEDDETKKNGETDLKNRLDNVINTINPKDSFSIPDQNPYDNDPTNKKK